MDCTVCSNPWSEHCLPAILDCNHVLCVNCCMRIYLSETNIPCPQCRRRTFTAPESLPISRTMQTLQQISERTHEFSLFVMNLRNNTIALQVTSSMKISELKTEIEKSEGIAPDQQRLIFCGKCLEDEKTLDFYSISHCNTLFLVCRLKG